MALRDCSKEMIARLKVTGLADMPEPFWNEVRKLLFSDCETKQVMKILGDIWCPQWTGPITTPVAIQKQQVKQMRLDLCLPPNPAFVHCDSHGLKGLLSFIVHRLHASKRRREPEIEALFAKYRGYWPPAEEGETLEAEPPSMPSSSVSIPDRADWRAKRMAELRRMIADRQACSNGTTSVSKGALARSVDVNVVDTVPMELSPLAAAASADAAAREEPSPPTSQIAVKEQLFPKQEEAMEIAQGKPFPEVTPKPNEGEKEQELGEEAKATGKVSQVGSVQDQEGGYSDVLDQPEAEVTRLQQQARKRDLDDKAREAKGKGKGKAKGRGYKPTTETMGRVWEALRRKYMTDMVPQLRAPSKFQVPFWRFALNKWGSEKVQLDQLDSDGLADAAHCAGEAFLWVLQSDAAWGPQEGAWLSLGVVVNPLAGGRGECEPRAEENAFCHQTSAPPPPSRAEPAPALPPDSSGPGADSSVPASGASQESSFMETQVDETPLPKKPSFIDLEDDDEKFSEVPQDAQTPFTYQARTPYYSPPKDDDHDDSPMEDTSSKEAEVEARADPSKEDAVAKTLEFPNEEPHEPVTQEDAVAKALEVEGEKPHEPVTQRADRLVAPYVIAKPTKRPGVELSQGAIYKRMNRIFTPRSDGTYLVDEEFVRKWTNLDTRDELNILVEKCDYQPEQFIRRCRRITQEIDESCLDVEHQFLTVGDMEEKGYSQSKIDGIKEFCKQDASLTRKSKYGGGDMYWVEVAIKGNERHIRRNLLEKELQWDEKAKDKDDLRTLGTSLANPTEALRDLDDSAAHGAVPMTPVAAVNTDIVKALRQTGFPDVESKATPSSLATKVIATIQKRLNKLEEMAGKITDVAAPSRTDLMNKMLEKIVNIKNLLSSQLDTLNDLYSRGIENEMKETMLSARKSIISDFERLRQKRLADEARNSGVEPDNAENGPMMEHWAEEMGLGATATSIARSVQARREEVHGSAASKTDDRVKWNATRNITRMLNRAGMAIEVPREILKYEIQDGSVIELPVVKPSSWLQLILKKYPELLFPQNNMEEELQVFWNHYRFIQPNHEIFKSPPEQLKRTLPILVHGDEGRYLKKGNYLIATIEMMLGSTPTKLKECCCEADPVLERYPEVHNDEGNIFSRRECEVASKQLVNLSGNCFLSKYLLFGMASQQYKAHPDLVHQAMGMVSEDLASLHSQGFRLGVGRNLVGSTLVSLALLRYYDFDEDDTQNLPDRLDRCSDCMLLTSFLLFLVNVAIKNGSVKEGHLVFFKIIKETLQSVEVFFSILYSHGLWLSRKCGQRVLHHLMVMLKGYKRLAHESAKLDLDENIVEKETEAFWDLNMATSPRFEVSLQPRLKKLSQCWKLGGGEGDAWTKG
ncbi:unnamed protein product [Cladocopium goreaui]|uniref:Fumarate reductase n=1 Tax=Cladocopium goreaui TaxID=2562237 RepID=A0A9P1DB87_9DINO|nr:unnamed protein product [Cladocopium goreaui]